MGKPSASVAVAGTAMRRAVGHTASRMQTASSAGQCDPRPGPMPVALPMPNAKANAKAKVGPMPVPPVPVAVHAPVGAPAALQIEELDTAAWFVRIITDVRAADEAIMGSLMFDHLEHTFYLSVCGACISSMPLCLSTRQRTSWAQASASAHDLMSCVARTPRYTYAVERPLWGRST